MVALDHLRGRHLGNGAREAVQDYFKVKKSDMGAVDHFLSVLWVSGFIIVPIMDKPPRKNPLQEAWDRSLPGRVERHEAAIKTLGRKPRKQT